LKANKKLNTEHQTSVDLRGYCTWRIGGTASEIMFPRSPKGFADLIGSLSAQRRNFHVLGRGSNVLFSSAGVEEPIIYTARIARCSPLSSLPTAVELFKSAIPEKDKARILYVEAGAPIPKLVALAESQGLSGVECLAGIPGSIGGAIAMNAQGVLESLTDDAWLVEVSPIDGAFSVVLASEHTIGYRQCGLMGNYVIAAMLRLKPDAPDAIRARVHDIIERKKQTQPLDKPSAGCVFRNPEGDHAGALLDGAGMKGKRRGGAVYSDKHANFIINTGGATSDDVIELMTVGKRAVKEVFRRCLIPEIKFIGNYPGELLAYLNLDTECGDART
jgi:UDP-N-acetylmuramate dehydrogenase